MAIQTLLRYHRLSHVNKVFEFCQFSNEFQQIRHSSSHLKWGVTLSDCKKKINFDFQWNFKSTSMTDSCPLGTYRGFCSIAAQIHDSMWTQHFELFDRTSSKFSTIKFLSFNSSLRLNAVGMQLIQIVGKVHKFNKLELP